MIVIPRHTDQTTSKIVREKTSFIVNSSTNYVTGYLDYLADRVLENS